MTPPTPLNPWGWFQFALPRGERRALELQRQIGAEFQFALPRGERLGFEGGNIAQCRFQFALPRGERPFH